MFCHEEAKPTYDRPRSRLIQALDTTVAIATLESFGVIDAREPRRLSAQGPGAARPGCGQRRRPQRRAPRAGRPRPATAAGRERHRTAMQRVEHLGK